MTLALVLAALVAVAAVVLVALPFLREPEVRPEHDRLRGASEADRRRIALVEERDRAVSALAELEFDHRTGKISDDDYRALVAPLRSRAASALRALGPEPPADEPDPVRLPAPHETGDLRPPAPGDEPPPPDPREPPEPAHLAVSGDARAASG